MSDAALRGLRVLELGQHIAAPYATKLLADLGADVIKLERPLTGDPLRAWGPFPGDRPDPDASGLFRYLNANKRGAVIDLKTASGLETLRRLLAETDALVENLRPGALEALGMDRSSLQTLNPQLALVRVSAFGQTGPRRDERATDLTVQAAGGWVGVYGPAGLEPVRVGGRMAEFVAGSFAACAALTAVQAARERRELVEVDLSLMESVLGTLAYPMLMHEAMLSHPSPPQPGQYVPFGVLRCKDGFVGINILTQAHWAGACRAMGGPEFADSRGEVSRNRIDFEAFSARLRTWLDQHSAEEIVAQCQALRIPAAPLGNGATFLQCRAFDERPFFVEDPGGGFARPGFPYRLSRTPASLRLPAPTLAGAADSAPRWLERDGPPLCVEGSGEGGLPFRGLRVLDLGTFWAGPYIGMYMASLGADVIKVESIQRPDGFRYVALVDQSSERFYETGSLFQATNLGKRGITLDLGQDDGRRLLDRLIESSDVFIENFAPRVMERFGFDYAHVRERKRDIVMVRMPAYGLEGPWREYVGWAMALAQVTGISWLTGNPDDELPRNPGSFIDPCVAMHAAIAIQAALAHRRRTGEGQLIELVQLETTGCLVPEPVIDYSLNGRIQMREGNRSRTDAPAGLYGCRNGAQVAIEVRGDEDWKRLVQALGSPEWARDPELDTARGRLERRAQLDARLRSWTEALPAATLVELLRSVGVPAAELLLVPQMYEEAQLQARDYFQTLHHDVSGERRYPVWPMRFSFQGSEAHPRPTPTLGQHNEEILGAELGLSAAELAQLRKDGVIGDRLGVERSK